MPRASLTMLRRADRELASDPFICSDQLTFSLISSTISEKSVCSSAQVDHSRQLTDLGKLLNQRSHR